MEKQAYPFTPPSGLEVEPQVETTHVAVTEWDSTTLHQTLPLSWGKPSWESLHNQSDLPIESQGHLGAIVRAQGRWLFLETSWSQAFHISESNSNSEQPTYFSKLAFIEFFGRYCKVPI